VQDPTPLRRAREQRQLTQEQVADQLRQLGHEHGHGELGVDANAVSRHERGVIGMPRPPYPQLYAELYRVPVERLWPAATMGGMDRRTFLQAVAAASGGALLEPAGADDLDAMLTVTAGLQRLETTTPAGELRGPVQAHLRLVERRMDRGPAYAATAADLARLGAWLAWDQHDHQQARALYARAVRHAERSGQTGLVGYMRGSWALWAAETGQGPQAVRIARQVPAEAPIGGWLHAMRATVAAAARDTDATLASLRQAERGLQLPPPPGIAPFSPPKLAGYVGRSYKLLGLHKAAVPALREALAADPPARQRASLLLDLAHVLSDDDEARELTAQARRIGEQLQSRRLLAGAR
jgi:transcriptional regulator with XRE-family HTH domain